jgi:hypothetical protein
MPKTGAEDTGVSSASEGWHGPATGASTEVCMAKFKMDLARRE